MTLEIEPIARALLGEPNQRLSSQYEWRYGNRGSLSIDLRKNVWHDHETGESGGCIDLVTLKTGLDGAERAQWLHDHGIGNGNDPTTRKPTIVATFPYRDEHGEELFQVVKFDPKDFRQRRKDPTAPGGYRWSVKGVRRIPYRLDELEERGALIGGRVFICEGEKDVDRLWANNIPATCNAGGAGKWHPELTNLFRQTDNVVVLPDRDPQKLDPKTGKPMFHDDDPKRPILPGQDHAAEVAAALHSIGVPVRVLELWRDWPEMPLKGDVSDWFDNGGTADRLHALVGDTQLWQPGDTIGAPLLALQRMFPINEHIIPPRDWIIPGLLMRKQVTVLVAPSGAGKSLLTLQLGIACAQGKPWSGWRPRGTFNVLFINSEDDYHEICRRLAAASRNMRLGSHNEFEVDQIDIASRFAIVDAEKAGSSVIAKFDARTKTLVNTPLMDQLIETIKANHIDVIVVDPFAETFEGDENSNSELKWAGTYWREVARRSNAAVCLVHHTRKYSTGMHGDVDAARGAGALIGIARIVSTLFPMTSKEAEAMGVKSGTRSHYLRFDDAKANLSMISNYARWFRKDTVTLENQRGDPNGRDYVPGDEVGVLIPWKPEAKEAHEAQIIGFFKAVDEGVTDDAGKPTGDYWTFKKGKSGQRYIGYLAQRFFKCEALVQAENMIKQWEGTRLKTIQYKSRNGHMRDRIVSELSPHFPRPDAEPIEPEAQLFPAE
jgi:AAA domain-containing protein